MRREEIEAVAAEIESDAREAAKESAGAQPSGRLQIERAGKADGLAQAARMLREALAKSDEAVRADVENDPNIRGSFLDVA